MLLLELNEYNPTLLRNIAKRSKLDALNKIFSWTSTATTTDDVYDSGYLEPWVQWVSVHTGTPSTTHRIKNLGEVPRLEQEQLWEVWSREGRSSVVWGVMNGGRGRAENCKAFIPDPWTFSEPAYPDKYKYLIELPRYLSKNYLEISKLKSLNDGAKLFTTLLKYVDRNDLLSSFGFLARGLKKFGTAHVVAIVFFEHVSAMAFLRALRDYEPDDAVLFLNMLAHVQHHYWKDPSAQDCPQLEYAASAINDILTKILSRLPDSLENKICVTNALSQKCTYDEPAWILHRPKNPEKLLRHLGLNPVRVEPLMTHDAHLSFASEEEAEHAYQLLKSSKINGRPLFYVERNTSDPKMFFYRLDFFDPVDEQTTFVHGNQESSFREHFISIVKRTGKHIPEGELLSNWGAFPSRLYNHEILSRIVSQNLKASPAEEPRRVSQ